MSTLSRRQPRRTHPHAALRSLSVAALVLSVSPASCTYRYGPDAGDGGDATTRDVSADDVVTHDHAHEPDAQPDAVDAADAVAREADGPDASADAWRDGAYDAPPDAWLDGWSDARNDASADSPVDTAPVLDASDDGAPLLDASDDGFTHIRDGVGREIALEPDAPRYEVGVSYDAGGCYGNVTAFEPEPSPHVDVDAALSDANPPSSGPHYGVWARWGVHDQVIPRGYWVHNLEHGGVVIAYQCDPYYCSSVRAQLRAFVLGLAPETSCASSGVTRRIVLTEDPLLPAGAIVAVSWGFVYRASCVDATALTAFVNEHTGRAPEDICADGYYPP